MTVPLEATLAEFGLSAAEYAVAWHVADTAVTSRSSLAEWTAAQVHGPSPARLSFDECLAAVDALLARALLIRLTPDDLARDAARWRAEALPVADLAVPAREPGDVDLTQAGADLMRAVAARLNPGVVAPRSSYVELGDGAFRALGETAESCTRCARGLVSFPPAGVRGASLVPPEMGELRAVGPWWYSRFERVETGFEIVIRFAV